MRVLLLSQFYPPIVGGEERHVRNLAAALARRGHPVDIATLWYPGCEPLEVENGVRIHRIRGTVQRLSGLFAETERRHAPPFPDPELVTRLRRLVSDERPDIVHAHNWLLASFLPLKTWSGARLVVTLHDYGLVCAKKNFMHNGHVCEGPRLGRCLSCAGNHYGPLKGCVTVLGNFASGGLARAKVDCFIAVSHAVARHTGLAEQGVPFEVIPNFVPDGVGKISSELDGRMRELPGEDYILFVGDLMRMKGIVELLQAYARLRSAPPLVMIGRRCVDTPTDLPPNVHVYPPWPHAAIMQAWSQCRFGVLPSIGPEACATVVMEAMATEKAIVASDIGGMPDLLRHGLTGLLVPPGDVTALADAMQLLVDRPQLAAEMGTAGLARVESLKASAVVRRIEQVYRSVLRGSSAEVPAGTEESAAADVGRTQPWSD